MARISSVSSAMEAYYKLTQSQLTENEIKKELSKETQKQSSDTSTLDDVRDAIGIIKDEVQFLNKAKDTFNEIYDILDEAFNYLKNLNQKDMESNEVAELKVKLDGYINEINKITDNTHNANFSKRMVEYIDKLTSIDLSNINSLLSDHEVQSKSRLLGDIDSNISTNEIINGKNVTIKGSRGDPLNFVQFTGEAVKTLASEITANAEKSGVIVDARNTLTITDVSDTGTFSFKINNIKTGSSGKTISGINITDKNDLTPFVGPINNATADTGITAEISRDGSSVSLIDEKGFNISLTSMNEASGTKTFNVFSEYRKSSRDAALKDLAMDFGSDTERSGGYVEFFGYDRLRPEDIQIEKRDSASIVPGEISIVGDQISIGTGSDSSPIGYIHSTIDGEDGARLRIKFYESIFPNGDFEAGNVGDTSVNGWTIRNEQVVLGAGQIGGLNTPLDDAYPENNKGQLDAGNIQDPTYAGQQTFESRLEASTQGAEHGNALKMRSSDLWSTVEGYMGSSGVRGGPGNQIVRGPYIVSNNPIFLRSGEEVSFDWRAKDGDDAYDVYGYLVNTDTNDFVTLLNETGGDNGGGVVNPTETNWANSKTDITTSGNYKFVFISGTYDETGGRKMGANLYLDNIAITPGPLLSINNSVLQKIADKITLNNVNMDLESQDLNPRVEAAIAPTGASLKTKAVLDNVTTSLANSAGGLNSTHTISVAGIYDTVGESIDTRTVTIAANASAKLISEKLNEQVIHTNVGFTAKTGVVISDADNDNEITFKLSNNNGGTALISANITTDDLGDLKRAINEKTTITGITADNEVANPIWTLGNDSLLLTHSSGEDIVISELTGVALNVRIANFDNTTYEDEANEVSLQAARNLIVNPITSDQQVLFNAENNSLSARFRIVGTNLAGAGQTELVVVNQGETKRSTNSFATVTRIDLQQAPSRTGQVDIGYSGSTEAISKNQAPVNRSNFNLNGTDVSSGTALIDPGELIRLEVSNDTKATNFTIHGNNSLGTAITETITSNPSSAVSTSNRFTTVTKVTAAGDIAGGERIEIETGSGTFQRQFTIQGTNSSGASISEQINSISNGGTVTTSNRFMSISQISVDGDLNGTVKVGIDTDDNQIANTQTISGAGNLSLTSNLSTPGSRLAKVGISVAQSDTISSNQTVSGPGDLTLTSGTVELVTGKEVLLSTQNNGITGQYTISGKDKLGNSITSTLNGTPGNTVTTGSTRFMTVTNVSIDSISPASIKIGTDIDDDGISTSRAYTNNTNNLDINGSFDDGTKAVLNTSDYDLAIVGTDSEGNNINETVSVINNADATTTNRFSTISSISISGSGVNTGRVEVYASDILTRIANSQIPTSGGNLVLTGANFQNDSVVGVGALQATSNQKFTITSSSNYYSLQNTGDDLDPVVFTTPIPRDTTAGLKVSTNSNHEVISTGELFVSSNKNFTITQEDASEELKEIQITSDGSSASVNFTITGEDEFGSQITETITNATGSTVLGNKKFASVHSISVDGDTVGNVEIGTVLDPDIISQSQRSNAAGSLMINGARTNTGTVGIATLKMASNFKDDETASFTLEGSTFTYRADGSETAAQARDRLLTNPGSGEFQGSNSEIINTVSAGILQVKDRNGVDLFKIESDGSADGLKFTESNADGIFKITNAIGNVPPNSITTVTQSIARRAYLIEDGSTMFQKNTNQSEVQLSNFSSDHEVDDQELTVRYGHALTDVEEALNKFDNNILAEEKTDGLGVDINSDKGKSRYTKEEFTEMGLKTAEKIRKMDTKTLIINNINAQKHNLNMLMSGQLYGFALLNFKGNFDLTKK